MPTLSLAVLVSGRGSNLRAILDAIDAGACDARVVGVVSDRSAAPALEMAEERGISTHVVPFRKGHDRAAWNEELASCVGALDADLVVLAGFMRILGPPLLRRYPGRLINVHPSLLPSFTGHDAPTQAIAAGVRLSGCTVHVVDDGVDTGPILAQGAVPVLPTDDEGTLHARIQKVEHVLLPMVIDHIARGRISLDPIAIHGGPSADGSLLAPEFLSSHASPLASGDGER